MEKFLRKFQSIVLIALLSVFVFVSCSDDDDNGPKMTEAEILLEYLETEAGDYINEVGSSIVTAEDVNNENLTKSDKIYIMDIRDKATYDKGHIKNAVQVNYADILTHVKALDVAKYDRIVLVCFSGQSAAYATTILRYLGYNTVFSMGFGMASWHDDFAAGWKSKLSNAYATQLVTEDTAPGPVTGLPTLSTGKKTGREILEAQAAKLFADGYSGVGVTHDAVFANLSGFYIVNYWPYDRYKDPGHIPGAVNYVPKQDLKSTTLLKTLPTDKPIVVYCYTGQGSGYTSAYLRLLGYDGRSLLYGASSMFWDILGEKGFSRFTEAAVKNYPYEK